MWWCGVRARVGFGDCGVRGVVGASRGSDAAEARGGSLDQLQLARIGIEWPPSPSPTHALNAPPPLQVTRRMRLRYRIPVQAPIPHTATSSPFEAREW